MPRDLLLEIGVEELPASFVAGALDALPRQLGDVLDRLRLGHGAIEALGTPRRLALVARQVADAQSDLDEELMGPPVRVAFDASGSPTKAAASFAEKCGCAVGDLVRRATPKGEYLFGRRREKGRSAAELLPSALASLCGAVPFRKSMRWADGEIAFGRPVRWLVALLGSEVLPFSFAGVASGQTSFGHRFLAPGPVPIDEPARYVALLRGAHVLVDPIERADVMVQRLRAAAAEADGDLIEDEFLVAENLSLVEDPHVIVGSFEEAFLALPERVILEVARGHQRYFGVRSADGRLLAKYLAVVNTARAPENVRRGNDRVMRARLADAKFFWDEDCARPLAARRPELEAVVFQKRLGTVGAKVRRIERLAEVIGGRVGLGGAEQRAADEGSALAKCDLVTLMVGEFPELQGVMGRAYALAQGLAEPVADVIAQHYLPRGAEDAVASSAAAAVVGLADRLDTLTGCFAIGLTPTGAADPLALRRAAIGTLRTLLAKEWRVSLAELVSAAYGGFEGVALDSSHDDAVARVCNFFHQRLRGVLSDELPADVVDACLGAGADDPFDASLRARALASIDPDVLTVAGDVFKRAANIAKDAPDGAARPPGDVSTDVHPAELALHQAFLRLSAGLDGARTAGDYPRALADVAGFAPVLAAYFENVFVMVDEAPVRDNRLRTLRDIHRTCSSLANFNLLARA